VTIGVGVGGALALGLLVGVFAKPDLAQPSLRKPMQPVTPDAGLPIVVNAPRPKAPLAVKPAGKLEVLSPDMARAAQPQPAAPRLTSAAPPESFLAVPSPEPARAAPPIAPTQMPRLAAADPACAGGRAAEIVCADPELAAADRDLNRAYRRALRSGAVAPEDLRADQRDWLSLREDAARRSPRALADVYDQRIDELNRIAEDGPG
jgi:hypothetical protein